VSNEELKSKLAELVQESKVFALKVAKLKEDAEDALHDAFLYCYENQDIFENKNLKETFHATLLKFLRQSNYQHKKNQKNVAFAEKHEEELRNWALEDQYISDETMIAFIKQVIQNEIEPTQKVFQLCFVDGFTKDEAATVLQCSVSTIYNSLNHIEKLLKNRLKSIKP